MNIQMSLFEQPFFDDELVFLLCEKEVCEADRMMRNVCKDGSVKDRFESYIHQGTLWGGCSCFMKKGEEEIEEWYDRKGVTFLNRNTQEKKFLSWKHVWEAYSNGVNQL